MAHIQPNVGGDADFLEQLQVRPSNDRPNSTSTGGAVNLDNSQNQGAGLVIFSSHAAPTGRLLVVRASNAAFSQNAAYFENAGTSHAITASQTASSPNATGSAINAVSSNTGNSCVFVSGVETARGTVKITHTGTGTDASAACLSLDIAGNGTAAQGIFVDATGTAGTTGDLVDLRNNGNQLVKIGSESAAAIARPRITLGNGGPIITFHTATPEGVIAAPVGSVCFNSGGTVANTTMYVKRTGTGNTGWFPVTA